MLLKLLEGGDPDAPAIVVPDGPRLTYQQLRNEALRAAGVLAGLGLRRDQAVGMVFENSAEAVVLFLAAALVGAAAPLNPAYTEAEFRFYLEDVGARALVVPPGAAEAARSWWRRPSPVTAASTWAPERRRGAPPGAPTRVSPAAMTWR